MKRTYFFLMFTMFLFVSHGQEHRSLFPDGFHIGITGEGNLAQRMTVVAIGQNYPAPISDPTFGWQAGLEFSYHFAKYYGISVGLNFGTEAQWKLWRWDGDGYMPIGPANARIAFNAFQIPIKAEFHYPILQSNFFFYGALGVNLINVRESILSKIIGENLFSWHVFSGGHDPTSPYKHYLEELDGDKVRADLQLNLGFYYKLPYNDLIRFSILANYSFKDTFHGEYTFLLVDNAYGAYSYRHNHIGFELAYVHCFKKKARGKQVHNELLP